jgi:hypothetical protein
MTSRVRPAKRSGALDRTGAATSRREHRSLYRLRHAKLIRALTEGSSTRFDRRLDPLPSRSLLFHVVTIVSLIIVVIIAVSGLPRSFAAEQPSAVPAWLQAHVGEGDGRIPQAVLQRARALYLQKVSEGAVNNPCYFAMDATRPAGFGRRFYVICEADRSFRAVPAGHGNGRNLQGIANFANGIRCAKNFSNAMDSSLTTGGAYVTDETITSFKDYYRDGAGKYLAFSRSFVQFDGEGIRPCCCGESVFAKIRTARTRTRRVTFRLGRW